MENQAEIVGVITKKKSCQNSDFFNLGDICKKVQIDYHYVENINGMDSLQFVDKVCADIAFCFGWSQLIKKEFIGKFPFGIIGFHPAALPFNRGRHPLIWALVLGLEKTASTFFLIDENADTGDIISQKELVIKYEDDARTLYDKVMELAETQAVEILTDLNKGEVKRVKQEIQGNVWRKRKKSDGQIDWRMSANAIYNLVRGLTRPYVGAHFLYAGNEYKVWKVKEVFSDDYSNIEPGKVLAIYEDGTFDVKTSDNLIRVIEHDFINLKPGDYL